MATKTGLLLTKTVRGNMRSLGKVDGNKLLCVVLEGLKNSPQFKMPFLKRGAFLTSILENRWTHCDGWCACLPRSTVSCSWSSSDLLGLQTTTCCHRLFQAIARYRAQFWLVSFCSHCCLLTRAVYNYIHNYQHLLTREPQNEFITY